MCRERVEPIFDLTEAQWKPIVEAVTGRQDIADFSLSLEHEVEGYYGGCGDKLIPTISYLLPSGETGKAVVFVKRYYWQGLSEVLHYQHLESYHLPIPRLYGDYALGEGREILFLEYLPVIGFPSDCVADWYTFFSLMARFNACVVSAVYQEVLLRASLGPTLEDGGSEEDLRSCYEYAERGALGDALGHFCRQTREHLPQLLENARLVGKQVVQMPRGLIHQDFMPDNIGWHGDRQEMVVFDIHKNALGPRFHDAARYFGNPSWQGMPSGLRKVEDARSLLTQHYLEDFARYGGPQVTLETFQQEVNLLAWASQIEAIYWMRDRAFENSEGIPAPEPRVRDLLRHQILEILRYLISYADPDILR